MKLKKYLRIEGITQCEFAKKLNITTVHLNRIINKSVLPTKIFILAVAYLTEGIVNEKDWK